MPPKKTKFVNIDNDKEKKFLLPGRHVCECQAVGHKLINNCLSCGRIVCEQEGAGACFFCGEIVMTKEDRFEARTGSKKQSQQLISKYSKLPKPQEEERRKVAQEQKERLLEADRNVKRTTKVIDDQSDYFAVESPWLSKEERKATNDKKEAYLLSKSRLHKKYTVTIDLAGRRIIEEVPELPDFNSLEISDSTTGSKKEFNHKEKTQGKNVIEPKFVGKLEKSSDKGSLLWSNRLQDSELQEMVDSGNCLSVNQPYASMIMEGIKMFEGRNWYTHIRGRLWIHASQKPPTSEKLNQIKTFYQMIVGDIEFPENFPLGCLLGCVDLIDCIPQEEYLKLYPNGEVDDPYVFVLANPRLLPMKLPMNGKLKIFKLEQHIHQAAKRALDNKW